MMKALLIEDETAAARNLAAVLREVAPGCKVACHYPLNLPEQK